MTLLELYQQDKSRFKSFMFDIDGTLLLGNTPIPGAARFLDVLREEGKPFFFLTNNSTNTHEEIAARLTKAGVKAEPDEIVSCSDPVPKYFRKANTTGRAWKYFLIGRQPEIPGVITYEKDPEKIMECDGVIHNGGVYDWRLTMTALVNFFIKFPDKPFLVSNPDILNPVKDGFSVCSNGQMELIIRLLRERGIEKERIHFGKPFNPIYVEAISRLGEGNHPEKSHVAVGDWLNSDIRGANRAGLGSCLVLTGLSSRLDAENAPDGFKPDYIVDSLS
jgi:HAD superfamily hydrolase (TIGR01450 family)